jgi:hypothetical protein
MTTCGAHAALIGQLTSDGSLLDFSPLQPPALGRDVRVRAGRVESQPLLEKDDSVAGYYLVTAADLEAAVQIASRIPDARSHRVTVRPLLSLDGITGS